MSITKFLLIPALILLPFCFAQPTAAQDGSPILDPKVAHDAVDAFKAALDQRWSYRNANQADFDAAIGKLRKRIDALTESGTKISQDELGIELQKIIALGIDGHSGVSGYSLPAGGRLPFLIEAVGQRFVAIDPQRRRFLASGFPYITKIDGHEMSEWCSAASVFVVKGSPQYILYRSLNQLRELDYWRHTMNLPRKATVEVELTDRQGNRRKKITLPVSSTLATYSAWPTNGSRILEGNIGYLRLRTMSASTSVQEIRTWMPKFRGTSGLIIDVRDNTGGDRDALLWLYSFIAARDDRPRVFTVAAYLLHPTHSENHLAENHRMFRANDGGLSLEQKEAIAEFAKRFVPQLKLPKDRFSDWHYMALIRMDNPNVYHYDKPVIVLMNGRSFSATDIFLAGLRGMRNVLLLGTSSGGGSAFSQEISLGVTDLKVRLGSMVSFQASGQLFDGNGIHPDIWVDPVPGYFIGGRDNQLDEGINRIKRTNKSTLRRRSLN